MIEWNFGGWLPAEAPVDSHAVVESARKGGGVVMRRSVRALVVLTLGWGLVLAPLGVTALAAPAVAVAQEQPPPSDDFRRAPELPLPGSEQPERPTHVEQRYVVGGIGAALIVVVLASRKLRGKSMVGLKWRKRS